MDYRTDIKSYISKEIEVLSKLDENEINEVMNVLEKNRLSGHRVFICGNGGSAATASHFCGDFNKGVSINKDKRYDFECLNDNIPTMMAVANDINYDEVFAFPLKNKMKSEDILIGISGSGNSANVIKAIEYANEIGATTIAILGYDGGKIKKMVDYYIHVEVNNMQIVEDIHMMINHVMMYILSKN